MPKPLDFMYMSLVIKECLNLINALRSIYICHVRITTNDAVMRR